MATDWNTYKPTVLKQESGGDYNALYNFAQKPGRIFAGVQPTQMTINNLLKFADPSGPYGQYVKETRPDKQFGVATPLGAYGVVGSTLRDAVKGLGLTGDELFDQATQDKVAEWLYNNRGASTWAASNKKPVGDIMAFQPTPPTAAQAATQPQARQPGLLSAFGLQKRDPSATGETALPFYERNNFAALMDALAVGTNTLRMNPDPNIPTMVQNNQKLRREGGNKNRTVAWLRSLGTPEAVKAAAALEMGAIDASTAVSASGFGGKNYTVMNGAEVAQKYNVQADGEGTAIDPNALYNVSSTGQITKVGGASTTTNIISGQQDADDEFMKNLSKDEATNWAAWNAAGVPASQMIQGMDMLDEVLSMASTGPITGRLQEMFSGFSSAGAAANAIIKEMAPKMRAEGSGSTSDIEYAGMLKALPSLINYPEANTAISAMMRAKAQINLDRSNIIGNFQNSERTKEDLRAARAALMEVNSRSIMTDQLRLVLARLGSDPSSSGPTDQEAEDAARLLLGG